MNFKAKRVLICVPTLGLGGAEDILVRLANGLSDGSSVKLLVLLRCDEDQVRVEQLSKSVDLISCVPSTRSASSVNFRMLTIALYIFFPLVAIYIYFRIRMKDYDVVHINLTQMALYSLVWRVLLLFQSRPLLFQTFHTNWHLLKHWQRAIFALSWRVADHLVIEIDRNEIDKAKSISPKTTISYIPFAVAPIKPIERSEANSEKCLVFGSLARLRIHEKKYNKILTALEIVKRANYDFKYLIGGDGPDKQALQELIGALGLENEVEMVGTVFDINQFLNRIDLLIVATVGDETGIAGLQALAYGVPLVGYDTFENLQNIPTNMLLAESPEQLANILLNISRDRLRDYWKSIYAARRLQLDDREMIKAYSELFGI